MRPRTIQLLLLLGLFLAAGITVILIRHNKEEETIKLQLDWKPEPEFGGFYAADLTGAFKAHGLKVEIVPGGVGAPTVQMVGQGNVDFGIASADQVIVARANGNNVVGLLAVYQNCPQGLMVHTARNFATIGDIFKNVGTLAIQKGLPFADFLSKKYGFDKLQVVPSPGGSVAQFLADDKFVQQCFVTSEPLQAKKAGARVTTFLVADAGFNPYTTVLICREDLVKKEPKKVLAMIEACGEGWAAYIKDATATNARMMQLNAGMDAETFAECAKIQQPLILSGDAQTLGLGSMTLARWETLTKQLSELKVIDKDVPAAECFVDLKTLQAAATK